MYCIFVLACLLAQTSAGYSSFFYSGVPQHVHNYQVPIHQNYQPTFYQAPAPYQVAAPVTYQSFPHSQFSTPYSVFPTHQSFGYHQQAFPLQFTYTSPAVQATTPKPTPESSSASTTAAPTPAPQDEIDEPEQDDTVITNAAAFRASPVNNVDNSIDNFRGFGYRNDYEGGSSSHFVFITGPEAYQFRNAQSQNQGKISTRTSASDAVDTVAANTRPEENHNIDALIRYLENPQAGVQRFYSVNNALVSRRLEDEIPAVPTHLETVQAQLPLTQPISPLFPLLRSSFQLNVETSTANVKDNKEEQDTAASSVATKSAPLEAETRTSTTTESVSSTTTTETSPTTEAASTKTTELPSSTTAAATEKSTMEPIIVE